MTSRGVIARRGRLLAAVLVALLSVGAAPQAGFASHPTDVIPEAEWVLARQTTTGPDAGVIELNNGHGTVVPYFVNIAASGLAAATRKTGDPRYVDGAWRWLDWYASKMDPVTGFITNYRRVGSTWHSNGSMDSTDGYAGTFLIAIRDAYLASGNAGRVSTLWPAVRLAVNAMLATDNGQWLTYAKPGYPHAFLMDNVEVYEAFRAVEWLAEAVVPDASLRRVASLWAANMPAAFETYWNPTLGGYDAAIGFDGSRFLVDWTKVYPTVTAQSWMLRTGLVPAARANAIATRIEAEQPDWDETGLQPGVAWFPEVIQGMRFAQRPERAEEGLATMMGAVLSKGRAWPYHVGSSGRLIEQMVGEPQTVIVSAPGPWSAPGTASFSFTGTSAIGVTGGVVFECRVDGGAFAACASPHTVPVATEGQHLFEVRVVDGTATPDPTPAAYYWTVDTTPPTVTITGTPLEPGNAQPQFSFDGDDALAPDSVLTYQCRVNAGAWSTCASPATMSVSGTGTHTFDVRAVDPAGNVGAPASHSWYADGTPPDTTITVGPSGTVYVNEARFEFTGSDDQGAITFECRLTGAWEPCTSPHLITVGEGTWLFQVRAVDAVGNPDPTAATRTWNVDRTPPNTKLIDFPTYYVKALTAKFSFIAIDNVGQPARFECSLNGSAWFACVSPYTTPTLQPGIHVFLVRAIDGAGFIDPTPERYEWMIDTAAPQAGIGTADGSILAQMEPTFTRSVHGTAIDDRSGIASVSVKFTPHATLGKAVTVTADLTCQGFERVNCTWSVKPPSSGRYRVSVTTTDRSGNTGAGQPSEIVVYVL